MSPAPIDFPTPEQLPEAMRVDPTRWSMRYLVDGEVRTWSGPSLEVTSPVCLKSKDGTLKRAPLGKLPSVDGETALQALAAANAAWDRGNGAWPRARVVERIEAVERFISAMAPVRGDVVRLLMWEIAKSRKDAEAEFDRTVVYLRDTLEALKALDRDASRFTMHEGTAGQIRRAPLGPTLCMGPFNYPLNETFTTLLPAILMGNPVVVKLPKYGGLSQIPLLEAFRDAFPRGVVNVLQGDGATVIGPILASGDISCLAFIGSTAVANLLRAKHPSPNRMRCVLGLGAKNPAIVMEDADLDVAVNDCVN
jgi:glyceraldehyde-3-phosphate dehydrogenase (NADP+)